MLNTFKTFPIPLLYALIAQYSLEMGFFMFLQQKISVVDEKQKAMMYIMPVFFTIFFMNFPSGLVLYWMVFNILSIAHQLLLNKGKEKTN